MFSMLPHKIFLKSHKMEKMVASKMLSYFYFGKIIIIKEKQETSQSKSFPFPSLSLPSRYMFGEPFFATSLARFKGMGLATFSELEASP